MERGRFQLEECKWRCEIHRQRKSTNEFVSFVLVLTRLTLLVLLAGLVHGHLLSVAVRDHLVLVGGREPGHALGFSLDHSVFLEACVVALQIKDDQIRNLGHVGLLVDDLVDQMLGGTRLAVELPSDFPALSEAHVIPREAGHFFLFFEVGQIGHHFHKHFDRLKLGGLLGGRRKGFVDRLVGDGVEQLGIRALEGTGGNPVVVNDAIDFGPKGRMEGFGGDTQHLGIGNVLVS